MIVFSLEKALGEFVKREHSGDPRVLETGSYRKVATRENISAQLTVDQQINTSVASCYLEEILNLAIEVSAKSGNSDSAKALAALSEQLDLFSIRNAIAHPNREFPDCYWYRAATIASDPVIDKMGLLEVRGALDAAEEGRIKPPPEEWMALSYSSVPNNLPHEFEHQLTGLVGRQKEKRDLLNHLSANRYHLISVLAPGGLGKTALALDVLRECSLDPATRHWCDGIVFISFKQERLTAEGLENLSASQSVTELENELVEELRSLFPSHELHNLQDAMDKLAAERIVICIDNLETLLRDSTNSFTQFYEALPSTWRMLITSRITVDGAKTLSLGALGIDGARALVYKYFSAKGLPAPSEQLAANIVDASARNPLALRLIVDRYANGHDLASAKSSVDKDIVSFSFKNLIETLSENSLNVLECLFVRDMFSRAELIEILQLDVDSAAEAVKQLTSTSLVMRSADSEDERFSLSPSVRDLLRENPRNIQAREQVRRQVDDQARAVRQHRQIQTRHKFSKFSEDFIGDDLPPALSSILIQAIKILRSDRPAHQQVVTVLNRLTQVIGHYKTIPIAHITQGRLYLLATDHLNAEAAFRYAVALSNDMPTARLVFVQYLLQRERPDEAVRCAEALLHEGWQDVKRSDEFTARRVWTCYFRALTDMERYEEVIAAASMAEGSPAIKTNARLSTAKAIILKSGNSHGPDPQGALTQLIEAAHLLEDRPESQHLLGFWKQVYRLFCRELSHLLDNSRPSALPSRDLQSAFELIEPHLQELYVTHDQDTSRIDFLTNMVTKFQNVLTSEENNPFLREPWISLASRPKDVDDAISDLESRGYTILQVYKIPNFEDVPLYVFGTSRDGERFFIHYNSCDQADHFKWAKITVGSFLAAKDFVLPVSKRDCPTPKHVVLI